MTALPALNSGIRCTPRIKTAYHPKDYWIDEGVLDLSTSCGISIGGMRLDQLTTLVDDVTCTHCEQAPRFPLDILNRVNL